MTLHFGQRNTKGFTIVELLVAIIVIGILASLSIVAYNGIQERARDNSVLSDVKAVESMVTRYSVGNNGAYGLAVTWYSGSSPNANIIFTPSSGNVIDVVASENGYCIRAYNPSSAAYKTLATAAITESSAGTCSSIGPSALALIDSPV